MYRTALLLSVVFMVAFLAGLLVGNTVDPGEQFVVSGHISFGSTSRELTNTSAILTYAVYYGGNFTIESTRLVNPIKPEGWCGAGKSHTLNVTIWSPYGAQSVSFINVTIGSMIFEYNASTSTLMAKNFEGLVSSYTASLSGNNGWAYFILNFTPTWSISGTYDVWVYANDTIHNYVNSTLYTSYLTFVNKSFLYDYSFNTTLFPDEPARLYLKVTYNDTDVPIVAEKVWVNDTLLVTNSSGMAYYDFIAPTEIGTYVFNVTLEHGDTYFIQFAISKMFLYLFMKTDFNSTIHLPTNMTVMVYNYTTGELLLNVSGRESLELSLNDTGLYLIKVYYHSMLVAEVLHDQSSAEETLVLNTIRQITDWKGKIRGILTNATLISHSYNNATRSLTAVLNGSGLGRVVYLVNYTKPLLVLSNTTILNEEHLDGEIIVDVMLPANITILDPRKLKVVVENPYRLSFTPTIEFYNLTVWEPLANATLYDVPAQQETVIKASYKGVEVIKVVPLLEDASITIVLPYDSFVDYRGASRELVANMSVTYESISPKFPYSRMRMLVSGTGGFRVRVYLPTPPTKLEVTSNTTITWSLENGWLTIEGTLHSTSEVRVTELYKLRIEFYDRLGNLMPIQPTVYVNNIKYVGNIIEDYLYPEDYILKLPEDVGGFRFYEFFDGFKESTRAITVNGSDILLKAWFRVPTSVTSEIKTISSSFTSWLMRLLQHEQQSEEVEVYVEGVLKDYYGNGVPNRPVAVEITNLETGYTIRLNATTDVSGYFKTDIVKLVRGKDYEVKVMYEGDDIYVESLSVKQVSIEALPLPVEIVGIPTEYVVAIAIAVIVGIAVALYAWRVAKHVIEDEFVRRRKFVKRKP